ncbi:MAG: hypothetical protein JNM40_23270 [Myxococcales bacterium]|nr:hypothetical protein [Myxococcales bacterium]
MTTLGLTLALTMVVGRDMVSRAGAEPQPHMRSALSSLESALGQLQKATPDKGGHRVKALELTKDAIEEVRKGIAFDNRH